ncbi:hypothetical protein [Marinitoga litoralis]|jgi:hypothetical protein|uniref:hypothetical protein n=1 Tax=Marinitoga litoralis TaxID=570855 RepID=UPI0019601714|nr:hypothetical protein [Marinitoga litoralis]MBM7558774.1 hypothetical protein [Marinitoga litoralis]
MEIIIDKNMIMDIISVIIKYETNEIIRKIFNTITDIRFIKNKIEIKVLFLKYYISILNIPEKLSGVLEFEHNLPINKIDKKKVPKNIYIDKNKIYLYIPNNIITRNIYIQELSFDSDQITIKLM